MTVLELVGKLQEYIHNLNKNYYENDEVTVYHNTYYVKSDEFLSIPGVGFIRLDEIQIECPGDANGDTDEDEF